MPCEVTFHDDHSRLKPEQQGNIWPVNFGHRLNCQVRFPAKVHAEGFYAFTVYKSTQEGDIWQVSESCEYNS